MTDLPATYDSWRTYHPMHDAVEYDTRCDVCDYEMPEGCNDGEECEECGEGTMRVVEPCEPCRCTGDACYC